MSPHSDTLTRFLANQSLLFLINAAYLAEKQPITNFIVFGLTQPGLEPKIYRTRGEHGNHYVTDAVVAKTKQDKKTNKDIQNTTQKIKY